MRFFLSPGKIFAMRACLVLLFIPCFFCSCSNDDHFKIPQTEIEFGNYFAVEMPAYDDSGKLKSLPYPVSKTEFKDQSSKFVSKHYQRFNYILFNHLDSFQYKLYGFTLSKPDLIILNKKYAGYLNSNKKFREYFSILANLKPENQTKLSFSKEEMMTVASRFFYLHKINEKDTTVSGHICICIHGQKELKKTRDYASLEAFCYEAIGYIKAAPRTFAKYRDRLSLEGKKNFIDFPSFLEFVKQGTFRLIEKDEDLKKELFNYYNLNKNNLGFIIQ